MPHQDEFTCVLLKSHTKSKDKKIQVHDYAYTGKGHPAPKEKPIKILKMSTKTPSLMTASNDIMTGLTEHIKKINVKSSVYEKEKAEILKMSADLDRDKRQAESRAIKFATELAEAKIKIAQSEKVYNEEIDSLKTIMSSERAEFKIIETRNKHLNDELLKLRAKLDG